MVKQSSLVLCKFKLCQSVDAWIEFVGVSAFNPSKREVKVRTGHPVVPVMQQINRLFLSPLQGHFNIMSRSIIKE